MYDRTSNQQSVKKARKELFTQKGRSIDALSPTQAALVQHIKRAVYQAGYCWRQVMIPIKNSHLLRTGDGARKQREVGKYAGQHYQRPHKCAGSLYTVAARKVAGNDASAEWLSCSALLYAVVMVFAVNDKYLRAI